MDLSLAQLTIAVRLCRCSLSCRGRNMEMGVTIVTIVVERFLAILVIKSWRAKTAFPRLRGRSCVDFGYQLGYIVPQSNPLDRREAPR